MPLGRLLEAGLTVAPASSSPGLTGPRAFDAPIHLEVSGERYVRPGAGADHRVGMFGVVDLGGGGSPGAVRLDDMATSAPLNPVVAGEVTPTETPLQPVAVTETPTSEVAPAESPEPAVESVETAEVDAALRQRELFGAAEYTVRRVGSDDRDDVDVG